MHVDDDEEIDGAVAAVLVIVAFELARRGRDWLAHLADELDRAFVEADHRSLGIGRFGIKVEHVFHAGDVFAIDMGNAPHVLAPRLDVIFGQPPANRLVRQTPMFSTRDQSARPKLPSTKRRLFRYTVEPPTATVQAISSSLLPASAASNIWARLSLRAACLPPLNIVVSASRSAWLNSIR